MPTILKTIELNTIPIPIVKPTLREFRERLRRWIMCGEEKSGMPPTTVLWLRGGDTLVAERIFARQIPSIRFVHKDLNYMYETYVCYGGPTTALLKAFAKPDRSIFNQAHLTTIQTGQPLSNLPSGLQDEEDMPESLIIRCPWEN